MTPAIARRRVEIATVRLREAQRRLAEGRPVDIAALAHGHADLADALAHLPLLPDRLHVDALVALQRTVQEVAEVLSAACAERRFGPQAPMAAGKQRSLS